jgi:Tfp pilus assembly protein PilX
MSAYIPVIVAAVIVVVGLFVLPLFSVTDMQRRYTSAVTRHSIPVLEINSVAYFVGEREVR